MALTLPSLIKKAYNVKKSVIENVEEGTVTVPTYTYDEDGNCVRSTNTIGTINVTIRPRKSDMNRCPVCGRHCSPFDRTGSTKKWRARDLGNYRCYFIGPNHRVDCPEHGHRTIAVEWADSLARFTKDFDMEAAFLYRSMSRSAVSQYLGIDWESVGSCISRVKNKLEPDQGSRLNNLVNIGVDETSYKTGHSYITVVVNHDTGEVVWAAQKHGEAVFSSFFEAMTEEQRASIRTVTGDGARWIDACIAKYCPQAERCVDPFHVTQWITEALNDYRKEQTLAAEKEFNKMKNDSEKQTDPESRDTLLTKIALCQELLDDAVDIWKDQVNLVNKLKAEIKEKKKLKRYLNVTEEIERLGKEISDLLRQRKEAENERDELRVNAQDCKKVVTTMISKYRELYKSMPKAKDLKKAKEKAEKEKMSSLKGCMYALLKNPEHLTGHQRDIISLIETDYPGLYLGYKLKEQLRLILHLDDPDFAKESLEACLKDIREADIPRFNELAEKIQRHIPNILNTIRTGLSNARLEATNNKIKLIIRKAYGFRNINNMLDSILLYCSNLPIELPNRSRDKRMAEKAFKAANASK